MSNWPKEDRFAFSKSEVMLEFEKRIIEAANALNEKLNKTSADIEKLKEKNKLLDEMKAKVDAVNEGMSNMTHDGKLSNYLDEDMMGEVESGDQSELASDQDREDIERAEVALEDSEEAEEAKDNLVEDMKALAEKAISEGNYKVAYKIERTISEILDGE